jgi:adenylate cyclase
MKRKIAAIMAADVAGYSRLVAEDEEDTLRRLASYRAVFDDFIARASGRVFNTAGDAILAEFTSTVEAVRCAIDVQESLRTRNLAHPPSRQMHFRIGITVGDIVERDGDLLGDAVNLAARLEGLAEAGGICVSRTVYEQVGNKLSVQFHDNGEKLVKNIPTPVHVFSLAIGPDAAKPAPPQPPKPAPAAKPAWIMPAAISAAAALALAGAIGFFVMPRGPGADKPAAVAVAEKPAAAPAPAPAVVASAVPAPVPTPAPAAAPTPAPAPAAAPVPASAAASTPVLAPLFPPAPASTPGAAPVAASAAAAVFASSTAAAVAAATHAQIDAKAAALAADSVPYITDRDRNAIRTDYLSAAGQKALAISLAGMGTATGHDDLQTAKKTALANCEKKIQNASDLHCHLYATNNTVVFTEPLPPMPPQPWPARNAAVETPFASDGVPLISASMRTEVANTYAARPKARALAISPRGTYAYYASQSSVEEAGRRALERCGLKSGYACMIVAVDDVFVVPIPAAMKPTGLFHAAEHAAISAPAREELARRLAGAPNAWNAVAVGAAGTPGVTLNAGNEREAIDGALADCGRQDRDCRVIAIGPFAVDGTQAAPVAESKR